MDETVTIAVEADTSGFETALRGLERQAQGFGTTLTGALKGAVVSGKSLEDTLRSLALSLSGDFLNAGLAPLKGLVNGIGGQVLGNLLPFADGGAIGGGAVLAAPSYFPMAGSRTGVAGEAGAEAILPLSRGADGRLGVASEGGAPVTVNVTIQTNDVASFRKSEAQVSAALARAVARGRRGN